MTGRISRDAFTLLEAILTLSLSVVLMGLIGFAIQFYASEMDSSDADIRRTQLINAVMQMIEDDLRSTLHPEPIDTSALESLLSSGGGSASGGGADASTTSDAASTPDPPTDASTDDALLSSTLVLETPGLIGSNTRIQVDVSQLPALEEYVPLIDQSPSDLDDIPSDIKTIAYFVQLAGTVGGVADSLDVVGTTGTTPAGVDAVKGGLVRRSIDRAAAVYATTTGGTIGLTQSGDLLASEIVGIEFEYWDGLIWQLSWNSDDQGELPLAVRVTLRTQSSVTADSVNALTTQYRQFQHIIRLPMAKPVQSEGVTSTETGA